MIPIEFQKKHEEEFTKVIEFIKANTDRPITEEVETAIWCFFGNDNSLRAILAKYLLDYYGYHILEYSPYFDFPHKLVFDDHEANNSLIIPLYSKHAGQNVSPQFKQRHEFYYQNKQINFIPFINRSDLSSANKEKLRDAIEILTAYLNEQFKCNLTSVPIYFEEALLILIHREVAPVYQQLAFSALKNFGNLPLIYPAANTYFFDVEFFGVVAGKRRLLIGGAGIQVEIEDKEGNFILKIYEDEGKK